MELRVVTSAGMRTAEEAAFASGVTAEALMDEAAAGITRTINRFFPRPGLCIIFAGKGNNAGDALRAAELLARAGWTIDLRLAFAEEQLGELARKKLHALRAVVAGVGDPGGSIKNIRAARVTEPGYFIGNTHVAGVTDPGYNTVVLDGLLGLGSKPPLREPIRSACRQINRLRASENAFVVALDLPTGLDGDSGEADHDCVVADLTITIGFAKRGLVADGALEFVSRLHVVPLNALQPPDDTNEMLATADALRQLVPRRNFGAYKNQFGRIGVVAGSRGLTGAAALCSLGALRAGAGLVELFVPEDIYPIVAATAAPEVMVKPIASYRDLIDAPIDVWAVGPGLGGAHADEVLELMERATKPMVIDADGLNIVSSKMALLANPAGPRLLTPHPGEMNRLFSMENVSRAEHARRFCEKFPVALLFKGSRTIVAERRQPISYNSTGHPGMATGGMGDVLTGVCAALIAQNLSPYDAARLGAWVCGRAAELAIFNGSASEQSLLPTDVLAHLGRGFRALQMSR